MFYRRENRTGTMYGLRTIPGLSQSQLGMRIYTVNRPFGTIFGTMDLTEKREGMKHEIGLIDVVRHYDSEVFWCLIEYSQNEANLRKSMVWRL